MTDQSRKLPEDPFCGDESHPGGINLYPYWLIVRKRGKMIGWIAAVTVCAVLIASFFMTETYRARAVIVPITAKDSAGGNPQLAALAQQLGGGFPGVLSSPSMNVTEIVSLLNSNIIKRKMIERHHLMPILFYRQWDADRKTWKREYAVLSLMPFQLFRVPDTWDALDLLEDMVRIDWNSKYNTITISVDFHDPKLAARIADYYLETLTSHMSGEVKRVAATNREYLKEQLGGTTDPFIRQKTYNMIAQQVETEMMAEVKENFAFKVIDPPMPPDKKIKPRRMLMVGLALLISLAIGVGAALALEYREIRKKRNEEVSR